MGVMEEDMKGVPEGGGEGAGGRSTKRANTGEVTERLVGVGGVREVGRETTPLGSELGERKGGRGGEEGEIAIRPEEVGSEEVRGWEVSEGGIKRARVSQGWGS